MSVAAATGAVSTPQHQRPTAEQIRLAQLIDDKKHDQPEVQDIVRKVLDVVANSTQEDALLALYDCDYDYEKTVALLIEKGHDVANEWRTATNHKMTKKQQQKIASTKNGHGETDENGQTRGNDGSTYREKSRGGRSRFQQQQNGGDSQNNNQQQQTDNYIPQPRQRGGSGYRGRYRGSNRGGQRGNDRNQQQQQQYEQQPQDSNVDTSSPSDTTQRFTDVPYTSRRGGGRQQKQQQWDVGNWNGETLIYSRSTNDEQSSNADNNNISNTLHGPPEVSNGQFSSSGVSNANNVSELHTQQKSKPEFDPIEAARQIKNVIGIGQSQQQQHQPQNAPPPKPLMDIKPLMGDQQQKSNIISSKSTGQNLNTKLTTPPPPRIPHQPVIFSDRFDGGMHKIDVQFGNLSESLEDTSAHHVSAPISSSSSAFYQHSQPITSVTKQNSALSSIQNPQRATTTVQHQPTEQSSFVSPTTRTNATRSSEQQQQPVMNPQRVLPPQMQQQQPSMIMKTVVPPQYAVHHQQHQMNAPKLLQSLLFHHQQQQESVPSDSPYDPTAFPLPSIDFNTSYYMAAAMNQQPPSQQQTQPRYLVSQSSLPPQQQQSQSQQQQQQPTASNRQPSSANVQTSSLPTSSSSVPPSSTSTTTSTAPKKGPAVPPGIFLPAALPTQPTYPPAYSTAYGVPRSVGGQQQTGATTYSTPYDAEHLFTNAFMQLANSQQAQSPSGAYGSVTPPVQQQNQQPQTHNNNDNKTMNYRVPVTEDLLLLQQYQQYAIQQSNSQQQGQQAATHSPAPLSYYLGHPGSGLSYPPGPPIMFAQPTTAMAQQQAAKQQGQQYNQNNSSSGSQIMFVPPATAMAQQQAAKQQGQQYNQNNSSSGVGSNDDYYVRGSSSSSNKEAQYMYAVPTQTQQVLPQSVGQQQGVNKQQTQQQQRASGNVYNNQQSQQRPFQ